MGRIKVVDEDILVSPKPKMKYNKVPAHKSMYELGVSGQKLIEEVSESKEIKAIVPAISMEDLILSSKSRLQSFLSTIDLVSLALSSRAIYEYYRQIQFIIKVNLHDLASIIRCGQGFGLLSGCSIHVGHGKFTWDSLNV